MTVFEIVLSQLIVDGLATTDNTAVAGPTTQGTSGGPAGRPRNRPSLLRWVTACGAVLAGGAATLLSVMIDGVAGSAGNPLGSALWAIVGGFVQCAGQVPLGWLLSSRHRGEYHPDRALAGHDDRLTEIEKALAILLVGTTHTAMGLTIPAWTVHHELANASLANK